MRRDRRLGICVDGLCSVIVILNFTDWNLAFEGNDKGEILLTVFL